MVTQKLHEALVRKGLLGDFTLFHGLTPQQYLTNVYLVFFRQGTGVSEINPLVLQDLPEDEIARAKAWSATMRAVALDKSYEICGAWKEGEAACM